MKEFMRLKQGLFDKLYCKLNEMQRQAVFCVKGPLLVLAGAGSGKTTVLVNRIMQIVRYGDAYYDKSLPEDPSASITEMQALLDSGTPEQISAYLSAFRCDSAAADRVLCITFTNKAANEFKERLRVLLGDQSGEVWAGTFHSVCVRILRRNINRLGFSNSFTIYDSDDSKKLITQIMKDFNLDDKLLPPKSVVHAISCAKEDGVLPDEYEKTAHDVRANSIARVYTEYQKRLAAASALDFDDIILNTLILFKTHPDMLELYRRKFEYILVDEYQDTNPSQNELVLLLGKGHSNVCVVGDDDQSIYSFRGATVANILDFDKSFSGLKTIKLEQNYRSTKNILSAANSIISNNSSRKGKELWTNGTDGEKIGVRIATTQTEESEAIADAIQTMVSEGRSYNDFAVLYRMNAISNSVENALVKKRIPYRVLGGMRFYERKEIKDIIAYLSIISNPDDNVRLRRIINVPKRQIGESTIDTVFSISSECGISAFSVLKNAAKYEALQRSSARLERFYAMISDLRDYASSHSVSETVDELVARTQYKEMLLATETLDKVEYVAELSSSVVLYEQTAEEPSLQGFLEEIALVSDIDKYDENNGAVVLMTVHSAKGLEFPVVFLPAFEEGIFPSQMSMAEGNLEEERRLAYVAVTRARERLFISHVQSRLMYGFTTTVRPSSFLAEIPEELKTVEEPVKRPTSEYRHFERPKYEYKKPVDFIKPKEAEEPMGRFPYKIGERIEHKVFGKGTITSKEPMGTDMLVEVKFDNGNVKKLMASFAKLTKCREKKDK